MALLLALLSLATTTAAAEPMPDAPPVAVFAELDGSWEGAFVGWDAAGQEQYRIQVRQTYRTLNDTVQEVRIEDRLPDGTVITGKGRNVAHRRDDGSLDLRCEVKKSNGDRVVHQGRLVTGPDGGHQIIWHSDGGDRVESFREYVETGPDGDVYVIAGTGRYGATLMIMAGRYHRTDDGDD